MTTAHTSESIASVLPALVADMPTQSEGSLTVSRSTLANLVEILEIARSHVPSERQQEQAASLDNTGKCAYAAILEMVAACDVDYNKLEELRDAKQAFDVNDYDGDDFHDCCLHSNADGTFMLMAVNADGETYGGIDPVVHRGRIYL